MTPSADSERLTRLEASVAHLERLFDELNVVVVEQGRRLGRLEKRLDQVAQLFEGGELDRLRQLQEKPPHYGP
ncbi:MAG: SlyX family protein [Verrucomicrobiales bacterium]|nr:SlyX family protein [Verrucomicrobiales bacterium]